MGFFARRVPVILASRYCQSSRWSDQVDPYFPPVGKVHHEQVCPYLRAPFQAPFGITQADHSGVKSDFGLTGLADMGQNLVLNVASHGFSERQLPGSGLLAL